MNRRNPEYKPILFTTTVRNPRRLKAFLNILKRYNNKILNDDLATEISGEIIRYGLYRPTNGITQSIEMKWGSKKISDHSPIGNRCLSDSEVNSLLDLNPQSHKEAGFSKGWPSRFATWFDLSKELGFVYYEPDVKIEFSEIGKKLAESVKIKLGGENISFIDEHPEIEKEAFINAFAKYQRDNPFVRVLNRNKPLVLLIETIKKLKSSSGKENGAGISLKELPLLIFWKDDNYKKLYKRIRKLREVHGFNPSDEVIIDICLEEIMEGKFKKINPRSITVDYTDEFVRKMRLTGLFSLRGGGRFLDLNSNEEKRINYILRNHAKCKDFSDEKSYFDYISIIDEKLVDLKEKRISPKDKDRFLEEWLKDSFNWKVIREELLLMQNKRNTNNPVLKYISGPVRLEFLTSLAIKSKFPKTVVHPNYPCDDTGLPTSTAPGIGNKGDIECYEGNYGILVEVTLTEGRAQTVAEVWPIGRHLENFGKRFKDSMCYFVARSIFGDSRSQIAWLKDTEQGVIVPNTISEFIGCLEHQQKLFVSVE